MTEHIHDKPLSPDTAPLFEGEPGFPQNQSPPVPTPHNVVNVIRGMQRSRMGISMSRTHFPRSTQSGTRSFSCYFCGDEPHPAEIQFYQGCGKQGHNRLDSNSKRKVLTLDTSRDYSGAVIEISLNRSE